ncbi:sulfotransferase domain-containing protein [Coleofasciculus sp. G2-EDA-02]|uniref:sulfotransferase domain-containing protein n=1 Tax=Coleofasciculus sp. G2-EDA-02 TaxID=3069529 RepID=UPI0032F6EBDB
MIIWLASYPRSGNTFFRILINQFYGIKTYSIYDDPLFDRLTGVADVVGHQKREISYERMMASEKIFLVKTHYLPSDDCPAIYLVRDGRDSLVSYAHYILSFQEKSPRKTWEDKIKSIVGWNEFDFILKKLIVSSDCDYGSWSQNVEKWNKRGEFTFLIRFEDLIKEPLYQLELAIEHLSMKYFFCRKHNQLPSFEELHKKWPQFFRKGKSEGWKGEMSQELQYLFWQHHGEVMQKLGYEQ